jgi:GAF domain-containing protein
MGKEKVLGVLNINDKKNGEPFSEDEFGLTKIIANQAAVALKNAYLVNKFRAKAGELEDANRKLIDADVAKNEFLTRISHELRTPLHSIKGAVYYLQNSGNLSENDRQEFHDIIANETKKLTAFAEKQLDFLRLEDEARIIRNTVIDIDEILKETLNSRLLRAALARKNLDLKVDLGEGVPDIVGDKILVSQFFINLLEGVSSYLENGAVITFTADENDFIEVYLDASQKLSEDALNCFSISKDIYSADRSEECIKLYLALRTAKAHGWRLTAENKDGGFRAAILIPKSTRQKIDAAINTTMDMVVEFASEVLGVNTCSLMLNDEITGDLVINCARGLDDEVIKRTRIQVGERIAGWVALEGRPLLIEDIETDPRFGRKNQDGQYNSKSLLSLPLKMGNQVIGVLNLNNKKSGEPFTNRDLDLASVVSDRISFFIKNLCSDSCAEEDLTRAVASLNDLLDAEKKYPKKNPRITDLVGRMMDRFEAGEEEKKTALYVSMIYDLGLTLIDGSVLGKKRRLSPLEAATVKGHPHNTLDLLGDIEFSDEVKKTILHHHERYDGTGYPDGLKGEEIPFLSRVLAVVDAYCAMTEERPHRKAYDSEEAIREIGKEVGTHYDPAVVEVFEKVARE